jgi:hypothetical protein
MKIQHLIVAMITCSASPAVAQFTATIFIAPCQQNIPLGTPGNFQVLVCLEGELTGGAVAADFRIQGLPSGWIVVVQPNPNASAMSGDFFGNGGQVVFPACQTPAQGMLLPLFDFQIIPTDMTTKVLINVAPTIPPADPNTNCAVVSGCQAPAARVCVNGFGAWINGGGCPLTAESWTWSKVKALYE